MIVIVSLEERHVGYDASHAETEGQKKSQTSCSLMVESLASAAARLYLSS
jgi:hypothetical protein